MAKKIKKVLEMRTGLVTFVEIMIVIMPRDIATATEKFKPWSSVIIISHENHITGLADYNPPATMIAVAILITARNLVIPPAVIVILPVIASPIILISLGWTRNSPMFL